MKTKLIAALILASIWAPHPALARQKYNPKYNDVKMWNEMTAWISGLDYLQVSQDYPKAIKDLLSTDETRQLGAIELLGTSKDPRVIPWLLPFMDHGRPEIHAYAAAGIEKIISGYALKDPAQLDARIVELRPAAGLVLKMFKMPDDGNTWAYASNIAAFLRLKEFEDELQRATASVHPATTYAAGVALKTLGIKAASNHSVERPAAQ